MLLSNDLQDDLITWLNIEKVDFHLLVGYRFIKGRVFGLIMQYRAQQMFQVLKERRVPNLFL